MVLSAAQRPLLQQQLRHVADAPAPPTGRMLAIDVSNYSSELTASALEAWKAAGVGLVIVQAFPPNYQQYQQQQRQLAACFAAGFRVEAYIYDFLSAPDWRDACLAGLKGSGVKRVWADEEDVTPEAQAMALFERIGAVSATLDAIEKAGFTAGIYAGSWWWGPYLNDTTIFARWPLWAAQYDGVPDASVFVPFGGWRTCVLKQYAGTSVFEGVTGVDLDVTS